MLKAIDKKGISNYNVHVQIALEEIMKTLLVLLDGMRPDGMLKCGNPYVRELLNRSAHTLSAQTVFPSVTLPCHFSLFLSVDPQRHGITTNTYTPQVRPIDGIFEQLHRCGKTSAFFYTWGELRDLSHPATIDHIDFRSGYTFGYEEAQLKLLSEAKAHIKESSPDFVFYYNGMPDEVGHKCGWMSDEYLDALNKGFDWLRELTDTAGEEYVTIVLADHGGHDRVHGTTQPEDMTIPVMICGKGIENGELTGVSIIDIAPTIAKILDIPAVPDWEGKSLV